VIRKTLSALFRRDQWEDNLDAELRHHVELRAADLVRGGMTEEVAARQARIELGSQERYKDETRAAFGLRWLDDLRYDARFGVRALLRSPGFALTAIVSMALGVGANTVVFSIVNSMLLRPIPIEAPEKVFFVNNGTSTSFSYPAYLDIRKRARTIADAVMVRFSRMSIGDERSTEKYWGYLVTGNYFDVLGVKPAVGTFFHAADENGGPNSSPYAVLGYDLWQSRFQGDPQIPGKTVRVNGTQYTVNGVAPKGFHGTESAIDASLWVPMMMQPQIEGRSWLERRGSQNAWMLVRAKPEASVEAVQGDLNRIVADLKREYPGSDRGNPVSLSKPGLFGATLRGPVEQFGGAVLFLGGLVLLAACVNLAALLGARAADRAKETALRISIGAGRGRLIRQLLTESVLLTTIAGGVGAALAWTLLRYLSAWRPPIDVAVAVDVHPDMRVFAFSAAVSVATGILAGMAPAMQAWRFNTADALKGGAPKTRRWSVRDLSLFAQTTLCCLLVVCSLVAARGVAEVFQARPGMDPSGVSVLSFDPTLAGYPAAEGLKLQRRALDAVRRIPGVTYAAYANTIPLSGDQSNTAVGPEGIDKNDLASTWRAGYFNVSPGYLRTAGTRLLAGRDYAWDENPKARIAIVNEAFARKMFGTTDAVGKRFAYLGQDPTEVIGVVEDGKYFTFSEDPRPVVFQLVTRIQNAETTLIVRSSRPEAQVAQEMFQVVKALDPAMPLYGAGSMRDSMGMLMLPSQIALVVLGAFGLLAVMLAVTGIYGLASYSVSRRVREIGIRMAIGARAGQVLGTVLGRLGIVVAAGSVTGIALGIASGQILSAVVYQASPRDPMTLGIVAAVMTVVALGSALGPIRRAISIAPVRALREE
jgi:predicted permease